jgi:hypothetical protein
MPKVISVRMQNELARETRLTASEMQMSLSAFMAWLLVLALQDNLDVSAFPDAAERSDCKLDFRLPDETLACLRPACDRLKIPFSVFIRRLLYAAYTGRVSLEQAGGCYKLVANYDQN